MYGRGGGFGQGVHILYQCSSGVDKITHSASMHLLATANMHSYSPSSSSSSPPASNVALIAASNLGCKSLA